MKETFATRSVNFDFQGPIFRLFSHKVVRNCYLIFILHTMFFYRDILELQSSLHSESNYCQSANKSSLKNYYNFEQSWARTLTTGVRDRYSTNELSCLIRFDVLLLLYKFKYVKLLSKCQKRCAMKRHEYILKFGVLDCPHDMQV